MPAERRAGGQPNYSMITNPKNKKTYWETAEVFTGRAMARPWSERVHIYDPARIVEPTNRFGVKFIDPVDETVRYAPGGMLGQVFPQPIPRSFPITKPAVRQFNTVL